MERKQLSEDVQKHLDKAAEALAEIAGGRGVDPYGKLQEAMSDAVEEAHDELIRSEKVLTPKDGEVVTMADAAKRHVAHLRQGAGWNQQDLADGMTRLGYGWKRLTVSEIESGTRKVSLEEMLGLAILFDEPAMWFLFPQPALRGTFVKITDRRHLDAWIVRELLWGSHEGPLSGPVHGWELTAQLVKSKPGVPDWRPVWDRGRVLRSRALRESHDGEH